jgi:opacity protein-like surface antigen
MLRISLVAGLVACALGSAAQAQDSYHRGYVTRDGTYVQPHYQTQPNATPFDNYSTRGNVNPYNGQPGTVNPYQVYTPPPVFQQQPVQPAYPNAFGLSPYNRR